MAALRPRLNRFNFTGGDCSIEQLSPRKTDIIAARPKSTIGVWLPLPDFSKVRGKMQDA